MGTSLQRKRLPGSLISVAKDSMRVGNSCGRCRHFLLAFLFLVFATVSISAQEVPPSADTLTRLRNQIATGDKEQKRSALLEIRNLRDAEASRVAVPALRDKDPIVRATAASSVVFMPSDEAASVLIPLLGDKDEFVRREAAFAAGEAGHNSATPAILRLLQTDKSFEVKAAAAVALGKIGDPAAVASLTAILRDRPSEDNEFIRRSAARSLGQIAQVMLTGKSKVITPQNFLPEKFKDLGTDSRVEAISTVQTTFANATDVLMRLLKSSDESDDTRREAAFSLGAIGDRNAVSLLQTYTSSPDPYLAEICKEALLKISRLHGA